MRIYTQIYTKSDPTVSYMKQMDEKRTAESIKADSAPIYILRDCSRVFSLTRKRQSRTNFITAVLVEGLSWFRLCQQVNTTQLLIHLLPQRDGEKNQIKKVKLMG